MPVQSTKLATCIADPQRISRILNWNRSKGAVMALDIGAKRIGVALTGSMGNKTIYPGNQIEYLKAPGFKKSLKLNDSISNEIEQVVQDHNVCAFVVSWPLDQNRRAGKPCGRVLHVLDHLAAAPNKLLSKNRPFALWEEGILSSVPAEHIDKWGRSKVFSKIPSMNQKIYSSKTNDYDEHISGDSFVASKMLQDFMNTNCRDHEYEDEYQIEDAIGKTSITYVHGVGSSVDEDFLNNCESNASYIQSSVL